MRNKISKTAHFFKNICAQILSISGIKSDTETIRNSIQTLPPRLINLDADTILIRMRWGSYIAVDPNNFDQIVGLTVEGQWEPSTTRLIMDKISKSGVYLNVGTSYGYYANLFAVFGGPDSKTYCVEANPYMIPYLLKSAMWSGTIEQLNIYNFAVSNSSGSECKISFMPQFAGGGGIISSSNDVYTDVSQTRWTVENLAKITDNEGLINYRTGLYLQNSCLTKRIDDLIDLRTKVDFIKMDIEGSEPFAILGAQKTISNSPDIKMIIEHSGYHAEKNKFIHEKAYNFLMTEGFKCFYVQPGERYENEAILLPIESLSEWMNAKHGDYYFER